MRSRKVSYVDNFYFVFFTEVFSTKNEARKEKGSRYDTVVKNNVEKTVVIGVPLVSLCSTCQREKV